MRIQGKVSLYADVKDGGRGRLQKDVSIKDDSFPKGKLLATARGEIQMVSYGISGIPVFQISRFAARELERDRKPVLYLDSLRDYGEEWIAAELLRRRQRDGRQSMGDLLEGMLPDKLAGVLLRQSGIKTAAAAEGISKERIEKLAAVIKGMRLSLRGYHLQWAWATGYLGGIGCSGGRLQKGGRL